MRYLATIADRQFVVEVQAGARPGSYAVVMNGSSQMVDIEPASGDWLYSMLIDGRSFTVAATPDGVQLDGKDFAARVQRSLGPALQAPGVSSEPARLQAPIPGLVVAIHVTAGQEVLEGEPLLVVEAMKMQMDLKSPRSGKVTQIAVAAGQEVAHGQLLVVVDESK